MPSANLGFLSRAARICGLAMTFCVGTMHPTSAMPPLSCEGRVDNAFWGLELLGNAAVWHTSEDRRTLPITKTVPLPGANERALIVIEDDVRVHLALVTETTCQRNGIGFPVSLKVLSPDDADNQLRTACCTAAE